MVAPTLAHGNAPDPHLANRGREDEPGGYSTTTSNTLSFPIHLGASPIFSALTASPSGLARPRGSSRMTAHFFRRTSSTVRRTNCSSAASRHDSLIPNPFPHSDLRLAKCHPPQYYCPGLRGCNRGRCVHRRTAVYAPVFLTSAQCSIMASKHYTLIHGV